DDLLCANTTSASPRRAVSSALPVPCATTFTMMPVFRVKIGRTCSNRPLSCGDVVEATVIDFSCADAGAAETAANATTEIATRVSLRRTTIDPRLTKGKFTSALLFHE